MATRNPIALASAEAVSQDRAVAQSLSETDREELQRSFAENGYVIIRNVVSKEKLAKFAETVIGEYERQKRSGVLFAGGGQMSGHLNCFPGEASRFAYDTLEGKGIIDLTTKVFGRPLGPLNLGCNLNLPNSVVQHYHVDSDFTQDFMIVNVAVVDTDLVNGAIDVIPESHRSFYKYWRFAVEGLYRRGVRLPMQQGDVLVRTSNLWHRGMPNRAAVPRPMLAFTFGDKRDGVRPPDPFRANNGEIAFHPNWFRPNFLGRLRERMFVAAPITYSGYRFVRSLFGNKGYGTP